MPRVFICYSRKDSDFVDRLTTDLRSAGVHCWRDVDDIPKDEAANTFSWRAAVDRALVECTQMVVVLSEDANKSAEVQAEWNDFVTRGLPVFPVVCRKTRVPYRLNSLNWWDLREDYDAKVKRLSARILGAMRIGNDSVELKTPATASPAKDNVSTLVVSRLGRGDARTINEAIEKAPIGARILIKPGIYSENITINKPVEIIGDGPREEIIIEGIDGSCLWMVTDHAQVKGLSLVGKTEWDWAVSIQQGQLILEDCSITSEGEQCVAICNRGTRPVLRRCTIYDSNDAGVIVYNGGAGLIEDCEIIGSARAGIEIKTGGSPTVRRCHIHHGNENGILVMDDGAVLIDDCDISDNAHSGIEIKTGGNPTVRRCYINNNKQNGIFVLEGGVGLIEDCDITRSTFAGLEVRTGGNPIVRHCNIHHGKQSGILVKDGGLGLFEDCQITENTNAGIVVETGGNPTVTHCKINHNIYVAVWVYAGGTGTFTHCDFTNNVFAVWGIEEGCIVTKRNNKE